MDGERLASMRNPAAGRGFFAGLFDRTKYFLITSIFNVFPLPRLSGFRKSFAFAGELIDRGWSVLVFPEGELTRDGRIAPFRAGIGLLAARLKVPVVPVRLEGLYERRIADKSWAPPGDDSGFDWRASAIQRERCCRRYRAGAGAASDGARSRG